MIAKYYKIRADFKYTTKGRFYRTFLVREDIGLGELGELIVAIFGGTMEHFFMYSLKDKAYIPFDGKNSGKNSGKNLCMHKYQHIIC